MGEREAGDVQGLVRVGVAGKGGSQADARHFGVGVGDARDDAVVGGAARLLAMQGRNGVGGGHGPLVGSDVGELVFRSHVARRPDVRDVGLEVRAGLQPPVGVAVNTRRVQVQTGHVALAPGGDQDGVTHDLLAAAHGEDPLAVAPRDPVHLRPSHDADSLRRQPVLKDEGGVGVVTGEDARPVVQDGHVGPEAAEDLPQLAADRAAAEDDDPGRQGGPVEDGPVGVVARVLQARDGRDRRQRAAAQDELLRAVARAGCVRLDRVRVHERGSFADRRDALAGEAVHGVAAADLLDGLPGVAHDRAEIRRPARVGRQPELGRAPHPVPDGRRVDQGFGRHAARVQALAADQRLLEDGDARPRRCRRPRRLRPRRPRAEHGDVELLD